MNDDDEQAGWWRETLALAGLARRRVPLGLLGGAALGLGGCYDYVRPDAPVEEVQRADDVDHAVAALDLQRRNGWNVGRPDQPLAFPGSLVTDADGSQDWRQSMEGMAERLAPQSPALRPWYVPTLFQSLIGPDALGLRAVLRPIHTAEMQAGFQRGLSLRALFEQAGWPRDIAVVVDAPGPDAVAIAAALSDQFDPVFTFGNWPHPLGVVPAHQTLAAALFFQPLLLRERAVRDPAAPPVFVLDSSRLAPYVDEDAQFDNRYLVRLPDPQALAALGIKHVMYVSADGTHELDDLNAAFVDLCQHGIDVRMVALGDFVRDDQAAAVAESDEDDGDEDDNPPVYATAFAVVPWFYFYGGDWWWQARFWEETHWGWVHPGGLPTPHGVTVGPPGGHRTRSTLTAHAWSPSVRNTIFGTGMPRAAGVPGSVGLVTVRTSRADGHLTGVRAGRTGSFASSSGWSGGRAGSMHMARSGSLGRSGGAGFSA